ncbi:MAG TPA: universal stress protein [Aestuariivirga sp.]|jgi:nucleotide-binding universal stress UspA family protein|nr:universal stress protein [Hyphomicrobiales bacterium]HQY73824.1 universal stress protein [Aestuariivirga sp.]HRA92533.1 universal stress protein [Aestuariivirga sp.]
MLFPIFYGIIAPDIATPKSLGAMKTAIGLAAKLDGQLSVAIGALEISVRNTLSSGIVDRVVAEEGQRSRESAKALSGQIADLARGSGSAVHTEILSGSLGQITGQCAVRARIHGLVFAEAGGPSEPLTGALIEPLLFESGRPVIVVPNGFSSEISLSHILIAWDGSEGAARAVWDAIPLLRQANTLEIATVVGEKELDEVPAANALAGMLTFLGKKITVTPLTFDGNTAAGLIKQHAARTSAGLVVQGAYGRSRWSELILGGVTREMLHDCALPVLMSH